MKDRKLFWWILAPLFLVGIVFPYYIDGYINPHDEGVWLAAIQALLEGKRLYRDIWLQYNPILPWLTFHWVALTSATLSNVRTAFWVFNALGLTIISAAIFRFIEDDAPRLASLLWLWLVPASAQFRCIPLSARYAAGFLPILAWPLSQENGERSRHAQALWAGLLAGLAYWIEQEVGIAAIVAGVVILLCRPENRRLVTRYIAGVGITLAIGSMIIAFGDGLSNYIQSAILQTAQIVRAEHQPPPSLDFLLRPLAFFGSLRHLQAWQEIADTTAFYLPVITYALTLMWAARKPNRFQGPKTIATGLSAYGLLTATSAWGRTDRWHIYFAVSPALFLGGYLVGQARKENRHRGDFFLLAFIAVGGLITLPHFFARQAHDRYLKMVQRPSRLSRMGHVQVPYWQANGYEALVDWIQRKTRPGEPIVFYPYDGAIYFLADRPNPCRLPILAYAVRNEMQDAAVREIEKAQVRWVIVDRENNAFDGIPMERFLSHIHAYIQVHYEPREELGPFLFMERK